MARERWEFRHSAKDPLSAAQRSANMRAIRAFGTKPEKIVAVWIRRLRVRFSEHVHTLPGRPDFVFPKRRKIVFVYGDFWHGWRFPAWRNRLPKGYWRSKIERNRKRDRRTRRRLRSGGWQLLVLWEHQILSEPTRAVARLRTFLTSAPASSFTNSR
jgi:DNA mismatch endonuclease (patch repair protein)